MTGYESKKAMARDKLAQDAFNDWWGSDYDDSTNPCIEGTPVYWAWAGWHAALAQPAQEPVVTIAVREHAPVGKVAYVLEVNLPVGIHNLYTAPPQRPWVGLTDAEAQWLYDNCRTPSNLIDMVETMLKDKNT